MYDKKIDKKWQKIWENKDCFHAEDNFSKEKFYSLVEFPYPSGAGMHVGHIRAYMGMEVISRMKRLQGYNVLFPIGFDAFGLPTENYAMKTGIHPRLVTDKNIETFTKQLKSVGFSFDFDRVIDTTRPEYFKWTQWIFLKLFENGLAYKDKTLVNYCPNCRVILANEESQGGVCDRCDSKIIQKEKEVWMLKITDYADKLLDELNNVDFPERVRSEQENWIGRSYGAEVDFDILDCKEKLKVYTTRPDTIFGVTYMAIAPEHILLDKLKDKITNFGEIIEYRKKASEKSEFERTKLIKEKTGVKVEGVYCINPITKDLVPLLVTDYVMVGYGTGAIMAVPAHDDRDFDFAKKFNLPIKRVIAMNYTDITNPPIESKESRYGEGVLVVVKHWSEEKYICSVWKKYDWKNLITGGIEEGETALQTAVREVKEETGYVDIKDVSYIPFEHFDNFYAAHKNVNKTVHQKDVLVVLASDKQIQISDEEKSLAEIVWLTKEEMLNTINKEHHKLVFDICINGERAYIGDGILVNSDFLNGLSVKEAQDTMMEYLVKNNLGVKKTQYHMKDWAFARQRYWGEPVPIVKCEHCGLVPMKENELPLILPEVKDFMPGEDGTSPLSKVDSWVNTTCPKCMQPAKRETDTMPQWAGSSWYYLRYIDPHNNNEFASKDKLKYWLEVDQYNGGMEHVTRHLIYSRFWHRFLYDIGIVPTKEPYAKRSTQGLILGPDGDKMSKSKGNVVNPDEIVKTYGADTLRTYILFIGEYSQSAPWSENGVKGAKKFLDRVIRLQEKVDFGDIFDKEIEIEMNLMIKKVTNDYLEMKYNTAIACMMSYVNLLYKHKLVNVKYIKTLLQVLNPVAPHVTEELWEILKLENHIYNSKWPGYDENKLIKDEVEMALLINSSVKFKFYVDSNFNEKQIEQFIYDSIDKDKNFAKYIPEGKQIRKVIVVKGRMVNLVVS